MITDNRKEYLKEYRKKNKEKIKEQRKDYHKKYRELNRDRLNEKDREYRVNNSDKIRANYAKYSEEHKDKLLVSWANWRDNNRDKIKDYNAEYNAKNKEKISEIRKRYYKENKSKINVRNNEYRKKKKANDPLFKLKANLRGIIYRALKNKTYIKNSKTEEILGCSFNEFKAYLEGKFESWMSWENYGLYNGELNHGWDIDHIIPLNEGKTEKDLYKLNHYTNLQPLCSYYNRYIKSDKLH